MHYISTRGRAPVADFEQALLAGLAPDGGLYLPNEWPEIGEKIEDLSFPDAAALVLQLFVGDWLSTGELKTMTQRAFESFSHDEVAPLVRIGDDDWLLELFHGPTLAFKDVAMQVLGLWFEHALKKADRRATIIGATSGDTGGAAIEAFRGRERVDVVILHPAGRISDVQRRIMTTASEPNIHNIAVDGSFDDCQRIVKTLLGERAFCDRLGVSAVNSINWARLAAQSVYYFTSLGALKRETGSGTASFSVPTGNFGDVFAGYAAKRMGAGVEMLCVAVNQNDILHRALCKGRYQPAKATPTTSPSMDIQVASNFERILFETSGRDGPLVRALMETLDRDGAYDIPEAMRAVIANDFISEHVLEDENAKTIRQVREETGMLIDPHTAVAVAAAKKARSAGRLDGPVISLATAHPAKFPEAVEKACGIAPELPTHLAGLFDKPEWLLESTAEIEEIRQLILDSVEPDWAS